METGGRGTEKMADTGKAVDQVGTSSGVDVGGTGTGVQQTSAVSSSGSGTTEMSPGDQVPPGTPGAGENICPRCSGSGQVEGRTCTTCDGTGQVVEVVGGGG